MVGPVDRGHAPYAVTEAQSPQAIARFEAHRDSELGRAAAPGAASPSIATYRIEGSDPLSQLRSFGNRFMAAEADYQRQLDRMVGGSSHSGSPSSASAGEMRIDRDGTMSAGGDGAPGSLTQILANAPFDQSARQPMPGSNEIPLDTPFGSDTTADAIRSVMASANASMGIAREGVKLNNAMMNMQKLQAFAQIGTEVGKGAISSLLKAQ